MDGRGEGRFEDNFLAKCYIGLVMAPYLCDVGSVSHY